MGGTGEHAPRRRRRAVLRAGCGGVFVLLWAGAALLAAEAALRYGLFEDSQDAAVQGKRDAARRHDLEIIDATATQAPAPPPEVNAAYPDPAVIDAAPLDSWQALAERWRSLLLACDAEGNILRVFAPGRPEPLRALGLRAAVGGHIADLVETTERTRLSDALRNVFNAAPANPADPVYLTLFDLNSQLFTVSAPGGAADQFKFHFHALAKPAPGGPALAAAVLPSRYGHEPGRYRAYAYQSNLYPAYLKSEFWTNGIGLRNGEVQVPKPAGRYRILCIGGSTTGEGPRNDLTYPAMLDRLLDEQHAGRDIEAVNAGMDGIGIGMSAYAMPFYRTLEPDLYIHYNYPNDVGFIMAAALEEGPLAHPLRAFIAHTLYRSRLIARYARPLVERVMPGIPEYRAVIERHLLPHFQAMHEQARSDGAQFALCSMACPRIAGRSLAERDYVRRLLGLPVPMRIELEDFYCAVDAYNAVVRDFCAESGALYIPTAENIDGDADLFPDLCHLYIPGLQKKAEIVAAAIAPLLGPLPAQ